MGFEFGVVGELDFEITLYCFAVFIIFVIVSEYLIGIMDYFLEGSKLYTEMIQMIYKELMLMGLVTFCVVMFEATTEGGVSHGQENWINGIDFAHVYLFFVTVFFVMHAFYLMAMSVSAASEYHQRFTEKNADLIETLEGVRSNYFSSALFNFSLLPLSSVRSRVEFSLLHSLFLKTYLVPEEFDFPYYLSGCFDQFALRTIDRSMFTWVMLLVIIVVNFVRLRVGWTCSAIRNASDELAKDAERRLGGEEEAEEQDPECTRLMLYLFLCCGGLLIFYSIILTVVSRVYNCRLVDRVYPGHNTIDDYLGLLRAKQRERHHDPLTKLRMTPKQLQEEIEVEFDEVEGEEEDEEGIIFLAESLLVGYKWVSDAISDLEVFTRRTISECTGRKIAAEKKLTGTLLGNGAGKEKGGAEVSDGRGEVVEERKEYVPLKHRLAVTYVACGHGHGGHGHGGHEEGLGGDKEDSLSGASYTDDVALQNVLQTYRTAKHAAEHHKEMSKPCCDPCAICGCCGLCSCLPCCKEEEEEEEVDFNEIYLFGNPTYYFRAVEMQIMFTCMYMGLWATNYVTIVENADLFTPLEKGLVHCALVLPIFMAFNRVAYIAETCSLILAISHLNVEVMYDVLVNTADMQTLASELRMKIMSKIQVWGGDAEGSTLETQKKFVHNLFVEVDQDRSGAIDKGEFRQMLRKLNLTYSDHRFNLLFRAVDKIGGDGLLEEEELTDFMFPSEGSQDGDVPEKKDDAAEAALARFSGQMKR
ncbi:hypothetical protein B484DRAFT_482584 [Ochromonadaceae sp. CCMP2298]|nr:hypothetical protein B484DRAFT_482584 [Ochromonadaceae sp. CCMP2298]|mmetsp:Transcript_17162/g.38614  ORF Transcript_17162/g.38614 Transcript_17162/m.38614 type:complete len:757 (+) Transcript_17162:86-2356(+)|eukprot:CAMPEP_0173185816 /NCGR_PEP_ID=MMETSP1141-20130122/9774_1 /TAXON_ID=483371 /ORGANISM="non described non described, Strain CCMP2298" /LENGTH=756 /DNA_ID=CAMNT_0014109405 /DNA_START=160 /DNA_END=2430 /DNA_ORIENTATION=-